METFRTLYNGVRQDNDGQFLDEELQPIPIRYVDATFTGTEVISGNTTAMQVKPGITGKYLVPIAWHVFLDHAGGTDFSGNDDLELISDTVVLGEATGALAGSADKLTTGTIASGAVGVTQDMNVRVKTGDPTGGHATAALTVRVWYVII